MTAPDDDAKEPQPVVWAAPPPPVGEAGRTAAGGDKRGWLVGGVVAVVILGAVVALIVEREREASAESERLAAQAEEARAVRERLAVLAELDQERARVRLEQDEARRRQRRLEREQADAEAERVRSILEEELRVVLEDQRLLDYLRDHPSLDGTDSVAEARLIGIAVTSELRSRGVTRLPDSDLVELNRLRLELARSSEPLCAQLWNGEADRRTSMRALATLSDEDVRLWGRLSIRAIDAELNASGPLSALDAESLTRGFDHVEGRLAPADAERFRSAVLFEGELPPSDACFALTTALMGVETMPRAVRSRFLRALAIAGASGGE